jgi:hypothetical protein
MIASMLYSADQSFRPCEELQFTFSSRSARQKDVIMSRQSRGAWIGLAEAAVSAFALDARGGSERKSQTI